MVVIRPWPFLLGDAIFNACVVASSTWVAMPAVTRILRPCLRTTKQKEGL
jgi:antibiotic biosynthesis monooxygenase (ABM) superfamily enzyme